MHEIDAANAAAYLTAAGLICGRRAGDDSRIDRRRLEHGAAGRAHGPARSQLCRQTGSSSASHAPAVVLAIGTHLARSRGDRGLPAAAGRIGNAACACVQRAQSAADRHAANPVRRSGELPVRDDSRSGHAAGLESRTPGRLGGRSRSQPPAAHLLATLHGLSWQDPELAGAAGRPVAVRGIAHRSVLSHAGHRPSGACDPNWNG